jgi:hypothetical protein
MRKYIWFSTPVLLAVDMTLLSKIFSLVSAASDARVWTGLILLCIFGAGNYLVAHFLLKTKQTR